ncbi:hypothetical protein PHLGIDRAFT_19659 [Phlebiopsis gigantea 11061_1 CR5-6]|uniref:Uncharacterized protein n=1 Tax=Phlebiopsis gigantea (strain 11061_1 CR5-6) TaxID=745531 RepID=A0A0C3S5F4_PHLG1|nr:hypothetical protein PHLGIDRAFT_19659 [Phlebiopsis gigantea 11061_1 CR5-6]
MPRQWTSKDIMYYIGQLKTILDHPGPQPKVITCLICSQRQIFNRHSIIRHIEDIHLPEALRNDPRSATRTASVSHDERAKAHEDFDTACTIIYPPTSCPCEVIMKYPTPTEPAWVCGYVGVDVAAVRRHETCHHDVNPRHVPPGMPLYWRDNSMPHYRLKFDESTGSWPHLHEHQQRVEKLRGSSSVESTPSSVSPPSPPLPTASPVTTPALATYDDEPRFIRELFGGEITLFTERSLFKSKERLPPPVVDIRYLNYVRVFSPFF